MQMSASEYSVQDSNHGWCISLVWLAAKMTSVKLIWKMNIWLLTYFLQQKTCLPNVLVTVLFLWSGTVTRATFRRKHLSQGVAYSFSEWVCDCRGTERGGRQTVLEQELRAYLHHDPQQERASERQTDRQRGWQTERDTGFGVGLPYSSFHRTIPN